MNWKPLIWNGSWNMWKKFEFRFLKNMEWRPFVTIQKKTRFWTMLKNFKIHDIYIVADSWCHIKHNHRPAKSGKHTSCENPDILLMEEILHQLIRSSSHYLQGFIHLKWCTKISTEVKPTNQRRDFNKQTPARTSTTTKGQRHKDYKLKLKLLKLYTLSLISFYIYYFLFSLFTFFTFSVEVSRLRWVVVSSLETLSENNLG